MTDPDTPLFDEPTTNPLADLVHLAMIDDLDPVIRDLLNPSDIKALSCVNKHYASFLSPTVLEIKETGLEDYDSMVDEMIRAFMMQRHFALDKFGWLFFSSGAARILRDVLVKSFANDYRWSRNYIIKSYEYTKDWLWIYDITKAAVSRQDIPSLKYIVDQTPVLELNKHLKSWEINGWVFRYGSINIVKYWTDLLTQEKIPFALYFDDAVRGGKTPVCEYFVDTCKELGHAIESLTDSSSALICASCKSCTDESLLKYLVKIVKSDPSIEKVVVGDYLLTLMNAHESKRYEICDYLLDLIEFDAYETDSDVLTEVFRTFCVAEDYVRADRILRILKHTGISLNHGGPYVNTESFLVYVMDRQSTNYAGYALDISGYKIDPDLLDQIGMDRKASLLERVLSHFKMCYHSFRRSADGSNAIIENIDYILKNDCPALTQMFLYNGRYLKGNEDLIVGKLDEIFAFIIDKDLRLGLTMMSITKEWYEILKRDNLRSVDIAIEYACNKGNVEFASSLRSLMREMSEKLNIVLHISAKTLIACCKMNDVSTMCWFLNTTSMAPIRVRRARPTRGLFESICIYIFAPELNGEGVDYTDCVVDHVLLDCKSIAESLGNKKMLKLIDSYITYV